MFSLRRLVYREVFNARMLSVSSSNRWNLHGKNIIVTGGSKGIGYEITSELCSLGAKVLTCSRNIDELKICEKEWKEKGFDVHICAVDVANVDGQKALEKESRRIFGNRLDCLVNNVGTNIRKKFVEYSPQEIANILNTNLISSVAICQAMYPLLKESRNGSIVNLGSVAGM